VLLEKPGRHAGQLVGRSPYLQPVQVMAPASLIGEIVPVTILEIASNSLFGELAAPAGRMANDDAAPTRGPAESNAGARGADAQARQQGRTRHASVREEGDVIAARA